MGERIYEVTQYVILQDKNWDPSYFLSKIQKKKRCIMEELAIVKHLENV